MKQVIKIVTMALVFIIILTLSLSSTILASNYDGAGNIDNPGIGPAPSSGDGVSEGPEWDIPIPNGPNS